MISKDDFQTTYATVKQYTNTAKDKIHKSVIDIQNETRDENINLQKIEVNSTTFVNVFIFGVLFLIVLIPQIRSMLSYNLKNIGVDPIWTTLWMCLFSYSVYTYSKFVSIRRNNIIRDRIFNEKILSKGNILTKADQHILVPKVSKDGTWNLFFYMLPIFLQIIFLSYSAINSEIKDQSFLIRINIFSFLLLGLYSFIFYWITVWSKNDWGKSSGRNRFYANRNERYVMGLFGITFMLITIYYFLTHNNMFSGQFGIGVFDLLIVFLISLRGLFAFIFYLYYKSPPFKEWPNNKLTYTKIAGYTIPISPKWALSTLLFIFLSMSLFIFPMNKCYNNIINVETSKYDTGIGSSIDRMDIQTYAYNWMEQRNNSNPIFLVAGQGGGSRAGYWTSSALTKLHTHSTMENDSSFFYNNCLAISTVSGSSVGAAIYLNTVHNYSHDINEILTAENLKSFFERDYISSSIFRLFFINPIQKLLAFPKKSRNDQLIKEEKDQYESLLLKEPTNLPLQTYDSKFPIIKNSDKLNKTSYRVPLFIPNTYNVDKKKKSIISSVSFGEKYAHEDLLYDMLNENQDSSKIPEILSIGSAVNLSQMFPFMSASAKYDSCHYYDGGVYDNSGLSTLRDIYSVIAPLRDNYKPKSQIILIYLRNGGVQSEDKSDMPQSSLATLLKAASGSIFSANTNRHEHKFMKSANRLHDTLITNISLKGEIKLNRWLSKNDCDSMYTELGTVFSNPRLLSIINGQNLNRIKLPKPHAQSVYFNTNDSLLRASHAQVINNMLSGINPQSIKLNGFADMTGGHTTKNNRLSHARAQAVKNYILKNFKNIRDNQVEIYAKGANGSIEDDRDTKQSNRRVDITFGFYSSGKNYYPAPI